MLQIKVREGEVYDEKTKMFLYTTEQTLCLEHSLISISKWESKWHKPFLEEKAMTNEEFVDYIKCMTLTPNVDPNTYIGLTADHLREIWEYMDNPMTATTIREEKKPGKKIIITSELIYHWMIELRIPFECDKWHFNRLIMLIRVCCEKQKTPKKMGKNALFSRNSALNAARKKKFHTRG